MVKFETRCSSNHSTPVKEKHNTRIRWNVAFLWFSFRFQFRIVFLFVLKDPLLQGWILEFRGSEANAQKGASKTSPWRSVDQSCSQDLRFGGQNTSLGWRCFCYVLIKKCSGHNKIWEAQKNLGGFAPECPPHIVTAPLHMVTGLR